MAGTLPALSRIYCLAAGELMCRLLLDLTLLIAKITYNNHGKTPHHRIVVDLVTVVTITTGTLGDL